MRRSSLSYAPVEQLKQFVHEIEIRLGADKDCEKAQEYFRGGINYEEREGFDVDDWLFLVECILDYLDEHSADDEFGTEGWRHRYGYED